MVTLIRTYQRTAVAEVVMVEKKQRFMSPHVICPNSCVRRPAKVRRKQLGGMPAHSQEERGCLQHGGKETIFWHGEQLARLTENQTGQQ